MTVRILPSVLSADLARLADEVDDVARAGAEMIHLDIMDGRFVPNLTFGPPVVRWLARHTELALDAHLMVVDPDPLLEPLADCGVDRVSVQIETCPHVHRTLSTIRSLGTSPGVAINPGTPLTALDEVLQWIDFVLVMSVNPGFGGQQFIPESLDKIRRLSERTVGSGVRISVDGGVNRDNAASLAGAGVTDLVAGSSVFGAEDRGEALAALMKAAQEGVKP